MRRCGVFVLVLLGLTGAAPASAAGRSPCVPGSSGGPACHAWTGKVTFVDDGDTLDVALDGSPRVVRVRVAGIQAMEQTVYSRDPAKRRGSCNALQATARLDALVRRARGRVRLTAIHPRSHKRSRLLRSVALRIGGRWQDLGTIMLREGRVLWLPFTDEPAWNARYRVLEQEAALAGRRLWDPRNCGAGPQPAARLRLWVNWDADGNDAANLNGEWIRVRNLDAGAPVPIGGWVLRDAALREFRLPAGAVVPAGGSVTLFVGSGSSGAGAFHWGQREPVFENATYDAAANGDGGFLFDPRGNLRAWSLHPCVVRCSDPLSGALRVAVDPRGDPESVSVTNVSGAAVDHEGYRLEAWPRAYAFTPGTRLAPGETLRVVVGGGARADTALVKHWDVDEAEGHLADGDHVAVGQGSLLDPLAVDADAVQAPVIEDHRQLAAPRDQRMAARDGGVVEHDVGRGTAADVHDLGGEGQQHDLARVLDAEVTAGGDLRQRRQGAPPFPLRNLRDRAGLLRWCFGVAGLRVGDGHGAPPSTGVVRACAINGRHGTQARGKDRPRIV
jgi:endonuclease YncB( thermonuclease family)